MKLSIVIPAYNEKGSIASIVERADRAASALVEASHGLSDYEILVVDDASTDHTADRATEAVPLRVLRHNRNKGYGGALKTGFLAARGDVIAFLDADGTYPPEYLKDLCAPIVDGSADMSVAVRDRGLGSGMPVLRRVGNAIFARLLSWIAEAPVRDSASGMRAFRRALLPQLLPLSNGLDFIVGLSTRAFHEGVRMAEVPIPYAKRQGRSKLSLFREGYRFLRTFITVASTYNPLKLFGALGLSCAVLASYLSIGPITHYLANHRVEDWEIYRLLTILVLVVVGLLLINYGIIAARLSTLVTGLPVETRSFLGRLLLTRKSSRNTWWIGLALCAGAVALNWRTIMEYLALRSIRVHWSYVFTGALMFLVGAQLVMTASFLGLFRRIEERLAYRRRMGELTDPGTPPQDRDAGGASLTLLRNEGNGAEIPRRGEAAEERGRPAAGG